MLIGQSLSLCVSDIVRGYVNIEEVSHIIAGTRFSNEAEMEEVLRRYKEVTWSHAPEECERVARQFISAGKVIQPRLINPDVDHYIGDGHWEQDGQRIRCL